MPVLEAHHDRAHPVGEDPDWSESWYFNAYAPDADAGFFTRIALRPNEPCADGFVTVWLPDGATATLRATQPGALTVADSPALGALRYEQVEPMRRWSLIAEGRSDEGRALHLAVDVETLTPALGVDAAGMQPSATGGRTVVGSLGGGHFEQACHWRGTLTVDGATHELEGHGQRDKSWGPRRTDGARGLAWWRWFSANLGDDLHLGGIRVGTPDGALQRGWIYRDGAHLGLRGLEVETEFDADGLTQRVVRLRVHDKEGGVHGFEGQVLRAVPLAARGHEHMAILEGLTRWTHGRRTGHGICEYAHRRRPDGRPEVADG